MTFHDDLVSARRRGEAPGQPQAPASAPVTFSEVETEPRVCNRCGAAVPLDRKPQHADWHARLGD